MADGLCTWVSYEFNINYQGKGPLIDIAGAVGFRNFGVGRRNLDTRPRFLPYASSVVMHLFYCLLHNRHRHCNQLVFTADDDFQLVAAFQSAQFFLQGLTRLDQIVTDKQDQIIR